MELRMNRDTSLFKAKWLLAIIIFTLFHVVNSKEIITSTERTSPTTGQPTEVRPANQPPRLNYRMNRVVVTAGKTFRYTIPADLFTDTEDGNLTFSMYEAENVPLNKDSWVQFIPEKREVYGLPLEKHISRWNYIVEARDSEGLVVRDTLDITVQHYRSRPTINYQFVMQISLLKDYANAIDWQIRALEEIATLLNTDIHQITVLDAYQLGDKYQFVWTNEPLTGSTCPREDMERVMKLMDSETVPNSYSAALVQAMSPELEVRSYFSLSLSRTLPCSRPPSRSDEHPEFGVSNINDDTS